MQENYYEINRQVFVLLTVQMTLFLGCTCQGRHSKLISKPIIVSNLQQSHIFIEIGIENNIHFFISEL